MNHSIPKIQDIANMERQSPSPSPTPLISIRIKCPAILGPETEDFSIYAPVCSKIRDFKTKLARLRPCHPQSEDQRLIYRGHVIEDECDFEALACDRGESGADDLGEMGQKEITMHMVLRSGNYMNQRKDENIPMSLNLAQSNAREISNLPQNRPEEQDTISQGKQPLRFEGKGSTEDSITKSSEIYRENHRSATNHNTIAKFLDAHGRLVETDLRNVVLCDGQNFYTLKHAQIPSGILVPWKQSFSSSSYTTGPVRGRGNQQTSDHFQNNNNQNVDRINAAAQRFYTFAVTHIYTFIAVILKFAILSYIIYKNEHKIKLMLLVGLLIFAYLVWEYIFVGQSNLLETFWRIFMEARRQTNPPNQQNVNNQNIITNFGEFILTFFISLFPAYIPAPLAEQDAADDAEGVEELIVDDNNNGQEHLDDNE